MGICVLQRVFCRLDEGVFSVLYSEKKSRPNALGLRDFDEGYFDLLTLYCFRAALAEYEQKHEINVIQKPSEQINDEQIERFRVKSGLQRMDSSQLQSNIREMSRLQVLVEIIHRLCRVLSE